MAKKSLSDLGGLVYSTELGRTCPQCTRAIDQCACEDDAPLGDGNVKVSRESKGRGGKVVTLIHGLPLTQSELKQLAKTLKKKCGVGGAVRDGTIEIQGEQRDFLVRELTSMGYSAKKSGG